MDSVYQDLPYVMAQELVCLMSIHVRENAKMMTNLIAEESVRIKSLMLTVVVNAGVRRT